MNDAFSSFGAAPPAATTKDVTTANFRQEVMNESLKQPVLVDFWAPWCGPCKQLAPALERAVKSAGGKVKLVKMNVDENPEIPGQLGIQSIPAVIAFSKGQPVDGFVGNLPESQIVGFIERLVGPIADDGGVAEILAEAAEAVEAGDLAGAANLYAEILSGEPDNVPALAGMIALFVKTGDLERARAMLATVPEDAKGPEIAAARAALELAEQAAELGDTQELERKVAADPADHQSRYDLALALAGSGRNLDAVTHLIEIIRRDRSWNDDGARRQLLQMFEAWGPTNEATIAGRRKLSAVLFA